MKITIRMIINDRNTSNMSPFPSIFKFSADKKVKKGTKKINNPIAFVFDLSVSFKFNIIFLINSRKLKNFPP